MAVATPDTIQTIGLGMVDKPRPRSMPTSPEAKRAQQIRENLDAQYKEKHAETPLQALRKDQDARDRVKSDEVLDKTFDATLDASTTSIGPSSRGVDRLRNAREARDFSETYLDIKGYAKLTDVQKGEVRTQLQSEISKQPWGSEIIAKYAALRGDALNSFLDRWAEDPDFRQTVRDVKRNIIDNLSPNVATLQGTIDSAAQASKEAGDSATATAKKIAENVTNQSKANSEIIAFNTDSTDPATGVVTPSAQSRMDALRLDLDTNKSTYDGTLEAMNGILAVYGGEWNNGRLNIPDTKKFSILRGGSDWGAVQGHMTSLRDYEGKQVKHAAFETTKNRLTQNVKDLELEETSLNTQLDDARVNFHDKRANIEIAKIARVQAEQDYADRLTNVFSESMEKYMAEREGYMDIATKERLISEADGELDPMKKALKFANANYWGCHSIDRDGKLVDNINKVNVLDSLNLLTAETSLEAALHFVNPATGNMYTSAEVIAETVANPKFPDQFGTGPEAVMRQLTMSQINPDTGVNFTLAEINAKLATDPEFFSKDQNDVVTNLVRKGVITKQISRDMTQRIINAPGWGGDVFLKGILESDEVRAIYDKKGYKDNLLEMFKDKKKWPWLIGLILAFGPAGGLIAILASAKLN